MENLPPEILICIFEKASNVADLYNLGSTSKAFRAVHLRQEHSLLQAVAPRSTDGCTFEAYALLLTQEAAADPEFALRPMKVLASYLAKSHGKPTLEHLKRIVSTYNQFKRFSDWVLATCPRLCPSASVRGQTRSMMAAMMMFSLPQELHTPVYLTKWLAVHFYRDRGERASLEAAEKKLADGETVDRYMLFPKTTGVDRRLWPETQGEISGGIDTCVQVIMPSLKLLPCVKEYYGTYEPHDFQVLDMVDDFLRIATIDQLCRYFDDPENQDELLREIFDIDTNEFYGEKPEDFDETEAGQQTRAGLWTTDDDDSDSDLEFLPDGDDSDSNAGEGSQGGAGGAGSSGAQGVQAEAAESGDDGEDSAEDGSNGWAIVDVGDGDSDGVEFDDDLRFDIQR